MGKSETFKIEQPDGKEAYDIKKLSTGQINENGFTDLTKKTKDKKKKDEKAKPSVPPVPFLALYRFAETKDKIIILIGCLASITAAVCTPAMIILFGDMTEQLINFGKENTTSTTTSYGPVFGSTSSTTPNPDEFDLDKFLDELGKMAMYMALLGLATFVLIYIFVSSFNYVSEKQVHKIRHNYLKALLRQNIGWYDTSEDRSFISRIAEDVMKIQEATSEKVGLCIYFMAVCIFSLGNAFWHGWKLTLVVLSSAPVLAIISGIVATIQSKLTQDEQGSYAKAGKVAEEVITNIRTVFAFGGQTKEIQRYADGLVIAQSAGKRRGIISGIGVGLMWLIIYASYSLAFWYGTKLISNGEYGPAELLIVFFSVLMGAFNVGQAGSYFEAFATGRGAAATIYSVIDRTPEIDSYSNAGLKPSKRAIGKIEFKDIKFHYPSRPEVQILKSLNLTVKPGQTVALVGHSGCGKSTLISLLQRFYNPIEGSVKVDDHNVQDLNLEWLRSQIGVVSQEPILFNTTIAENIRYGRDGVSQQEIEEAAKRANAHSFIRKLPNGYDTNVGNRGTQLSGGQKQRIAIARAIIRECPILLLDEATSALDTQSESIVQAALDKAREGRTTLIVAHRLSTIRNADVVVSINDGQVEEKGTHSELLEKKGLYYQLVTTQMAGHEDDDMIAVEETDSSGDKHLVVRKSIPNEDEEVIDFVQASEENIDEDDLAKEVSLLRLLKYNKPEIAYMIVGTIAAIVQGAALPFYAIIFGEFMGNLSKPDPQAEGNKFALYFLGIGLIAGTAQFLQIFAFTFSGEALTMRLRKLSFGALLRQEAAWFDDPSRSIGSLCSRLSGDAASVNGATGSRIGILVQAISTLSFAVGLSMYVLPKLGGVALAFVPIVLIGTYFEGKLMTTQSVGEKKALESAAKVAVEAVSNIRTVASLGKEKDFVKVYIDNIKKPHKNALKRAHVRGLIFGVAQATPLLAYSVVLYYGGYLVKNEGYDFKNVFKVAEALIFGSMMIGQAMAFAPNYHKAKVSGARILRLLDRRPLIENSPGVGLKINDSKGKVQFEKVSFCYPTRPAAKILRGLSFDVEPGKNIALVGHSGCGKSSCINLVLRYYDPISGAVKLDEIDISSLNVASLRSQMSIVSQEPALFDRTLKDNIAYGDNSRDVKIDEIIQAAKLANIHTFISSLPAQYDTMVGDMGSKLSGGQKQRVAIARALVKSPRVLLLDEATSALDMESEKVVQEALDAASTGRTTITIAHRLSSIQNSDKIFVINNGVLAEAGTHSELLQHQGIYSRLWGMQQGVGRS